MITVEEAKRLAHELSSTTELSHAGALESVARAAGFSDWDTMATADDRGVDVRTDAASEPAAPAAPAEPSVIPVLRVFDHAIARRFYCEYLGFE